MDRDIDDIPVKERLTTDLKKTDTEYLLLIKQIIELQNTDIKIHKAIISSVVPEITEKFYNAIKKLFDLDNIVVLDS